MTQTDDYKIVNTTRKDFDAILEFLETDFLQNEPLNASIQLSVEDSRDFFKELITAGLEDPFSFIAKNSNGQVIGIRLSAIIRRPISNGNHKNNDSFDGSLFDESPTNTKSEKLQKIRQFISELESKIWELVPNNINCLLNVIIISVSSNYTRRGIARKLLEHGHEMAKELGCQGIFTEATALGSQRLFKSLGYQELYVIKHSQWIDPETGKQIFRCNDRTDRGVLAYKPF